MKSDIPDFPVLFAKFDNAIIGPEDDIHYPSITEKLDYEVELTLVIGKTASKVKKKKMLLIILPDTHLQMIHLRVIYKKKDTTMAARKNT